MFPAEAGEPLLSPKDLEAPSLAQARADGLLPSWDACLARYAEQATGPAATDRL